MESSFLPYEDDIIRHPQSLRSWCRFLSYLNEGNYVGYRIVVFERALAVFPRSYKLWHDYLNYRVDLLRQHKTLLYVEEGSSLATDVLYLFERAVLCLSQCPRLWLDYLAFLRFCYQTGCQHGILTFMRRAFARALQNLPLGQHSRIWEFALDWLSLPRDDANIEDALTFKPMVPVATITSLLRKYLYFRPKYRTLLKNFLLKLENSEYRPFLIDLLIQLGTDTDTLLKLIVESVTWNDQSVREPEMSHGDTKQLAPRMEPASASLRITETLPLDKAEMIFEQYVVDPSINQGLAWSLYATLYLKLRDIDKAYGTYDRALDAVRSVRDFGLVFDAYAKLQETYIEKLLSRVERLKRRQKAAQETSDGAESTVDYEASIASLKAEIDRRFLQLELLLGCRDEYLSNTKLRAEPNNVDYWLDRSVLLEPIPVLTKAVMTVDPMKVTGAKRYADLWLCLSEYAADRSVVFEKAVLLEYKSIHELEDVWLAYIEAVDTNSGIELLARALKPADNRGHYGYPLHKSLKLWLKLIDFEKKSSETNAGSSSTGERGSGLTEGNGEHSVPFSPRVKAAYEQLLELKIANLGVILEYCQYLEQYGYLEQSFRVYEKSLGLFVLDSSSGRSASADVLYEVLKVYLPKATARLSAERMRDTFDYALEVLGSCQGRISEYLTPIYVLYALYEEKQTPRKALRILDVAVRNDRIDTEHRKQLMDLLLVKTLHYGGLLATRPIYDYALETFTASASILKDYCLQYATMETKLGEAERARRIYTYGSQYLNPQLLPVYWTAWDDFETSYGNRDTYREMLRIKRSVAEYYEREQPAFVKGELKGAPDLLQELETQESPPNEAEPDALQLRQETE